MKRILHLDDEADIREILGAYLQTLGYEVVSVATPTEALREVERTPPHLIICDLQLEESDGLEAIERLRATNPEVPVILLTGVLLAPHVAEEILQKRRIVYVEKTKPLNTIVDEVRRLTTD